jgi:hypothetical protein
VGYKLIKEVIPVIYRQKMTIKRITKHHDCLRFLAKTNPKLRRCVIKAADKDLIYCICECIQNVLRANVPIPPNTIKQLKPYKGTMESIVNKRTNIGHKKRLIAQNGGFLPILLAPLLGVIGSLVGDTLARNVYT